VELSTIVYAGLMTRGDFWNLFFAVFFAAIAIAMAGFLYQLYGEAPTWIPFFDLVLIVLATMRLTRLFVYDAVTIFFRNWFAGSPRGSFLGTMGTLVNCPWCLGLWFALFVVFFYFLSPISWFFILFLAVASLASFLQIIANNIGWNAEYRKLKTRKIEQEIRLE
jgi:ABC-type multidrug transport system fused ATPase/permease subunit